MADKTGIAWADATINPCYGCTPVSPACDNCYAARMSARMAHNPAVCQYFEGLTDKNNRWTGRINLFPQKMEQALRWKRPRRIFVGSMTDIFHEAVPGAFLDDVFACMALAHWHTFIVLTKRPARMAAYLTDEDVALRVAETEPVYEAQNLVDGEDDAMTTNQQKMAVRYEDGLNALGKWENNKSLPNVILMTTVEDQPRADERIPHLMALAGMGWKTGVSVEPMLGPVDLNRIHESGESEHGMHWESWESCLTGRRFDIWADRESEGYPRLSWVICGGESGPNARPMHPDWVRSLRDQCAAAGTPFLFKQWGELAPCRLQKIHGAYNRTNGRDHWELDPKCTGTMHRIGKHAAGRLLDGVEHNQFPEVQP